MHTGCERRRRVKFFAQLSRKKAGRGAGAQWAPFSAWSPLPLGNVPPGRCGPQRGSQVGAPPEACRKLSLASPFGGGGLALARTERASCQRPPRMGCVEALAGCPLSRLTATAPPRGEPSMCATKSLRKAKSRLPLWGRCHAFGMTERARRWLAAPLSGSHLLGALLSGKSGAKPLFP